MSDKLPNKFLLTVDPKLLICCRNVFRLQICPSCKCYSVNMACLKALSLSENISMHKRSDPCVNLLVVDDFYRVLILSVCPMPRYCLKSIVHIANLFTVRWDHDISSRLRWHFAQPRGPRCPSALPSLTSISAMSRPCGAKNLIFGLWVNLIPEVCRFAASCRY